VTAANWLYYRSFILVPADHTDLCASVVCPASLSLSLHLSHEASSSQAETSAVCWSRWRRRTRPDLTHFTTHANPGKLQMHHSLRPLGHKVMVLFDRSCWQTAGLEVFSPEEAHVLCVPLHCDTERLLLIVARGVQDHREFQTPGKKGITFSFVALEIHLVGYTRVGGRKQKWPFNWADY